MVNIVIGMKHLKIEKLKNIKIPNIHMLIFN